MPGEEIGTEEEYLPGENTYIKDGKIKSSCFGELHIDSKRRATVIPYKEVAKFKIGDIVYARVDEILESLAFLSIENEVGLTAFGILLISEIKQGFVKSIRDELRIGDIIKAKIKKITPFSIELTLKERGLGVVKAFCSNCRAQMVYKSGIFVCEKCGNKERRVIN
jgi:exosome complex component CSL4